MESWKTYTIGDLGTVVTGKTPTPKKAEYWNGEIMFVTPKDLQSTKHIFSTERRITPLGLQAVRNSILPPGAICVSCIGNIGYVSMTTQECVSNQQINSVIVNEYNDPDYVFYLLKGLWHFFKNYEGQSTILSILNKSQFSKIKIKVPNLETQKRIAGLLSSIDNMIELNNQINKNLG
ncbi:MAG: restriction endonuclease subunit S, partial [Allobaculum sp.]|nr:restriction endonuclease subunit S [Allobaculum sp.]